jgi:predicted nucleic acid-binding protein
MKMNGNLLDTNVIVKIFRGDEETAKVLDSIPVEDVYISAITLGELYYGATCSKKREENFSIINEFVSFYKLLEINKEISIKYSTLKYDLKIKGFTIPENDLWIASTGLYYNLNVLSYDKHFKNIDGLKLFFKF